jgi:transcriptional regulator with XRE-family HTH domain
VLGRLVRAYRTGQGFSQAELAGTAGIDVKTVSNIEAGRTRPRPSTLGVLGRALRLDDEQLRQLFTMLNEDDDPQDDRGLPAPLPPALPAQLPGDILGFVGRAESMRQLDRLLPDSGAPAPSALAIGILTGTAGVGKTALAVHWAHRAAHLFPDGQLYVNLRGFDSGEPVNPATAVRGFLDALGVPAWRIPAEADAQAALYRTLLAGRRMLLVLDNARDSTQVAPLLPGSPGCLVVVTSRNQLNGLIVAQAAHRLTLDLLSDRSAHDLLARRLGADRVDAEPESVRRIVTRCARLPLALALAAAHATTHPQLPLSAVADRLDARAHRLDVLGGDDDPHTDLCSVFSWSYRALSPSAAWLFRTLGPHPGPEITVTAVSAATGQPPERVRRLLNELTRANLIAEHRPGRYTLHALLRDYAVHLAETEASAA